MTQFAIEDASFPYKIASCSPLPGQHNPLHIAGVIDHLDRNMPLKHALFINDFLFQERSSIVNRKKKKKKPKVYHRLAHPVGTY